MQAKKTIKANISCSTCSRRREQGGYIKVYGGTFVGQNPADGDDALGGSFVADGYEAVVSKAATDESLAEYTVQKAQ